MGRNRVRSIRRCIWAYFFNNDLSLPGFNNSKNWNPWQFSYIILNFFIWIKIFVLTPFFLLFLFCFLFTNYIFFCHPLHWHTLFKKQQFYNFWERTKLFGILRTSNKIDRNCIHGIKTIQIWIRDMPVYIASRVGFTVRTEVKDSEFFGVVTVKFSFIFFIRFISCKNTLPKVRKWVFLININLKTFKPIVW